MPFAAITRMHVPMLTTGLSFMGLVYEERIFRERWETAKDRERDKPITFDPMPLDGDENPYYMVANVNVERTRMERRHGKALFYRCYTIESFEAAYKAVVIPTNEWEKARAQSDAMARAKAHADEVTANAALISHTVREVAKQAVAAHREDDAEVDSEDSDPVPKRRGRPPGKLQTVPA